MAVQISNNYRAFSLNGSNFKRIDNKLRLVLHAHSGLVAAHGEDIYDLYQYIRAGAREVHVGINH